MSKSLSAPGVDESLLRSNAASDVRYVVTLKRALELAGGEEQLAAILRTSPNVLRKWLSGRQQPPVNKYVAALQLVTSAAEKSRET